MPDTSDPPTLLAHLIPQFAHPENVAVEALGHILAQSASARAALAELLRDGGVDVGPVFTVRTQATGESGERPDLQVLDEHGRERTLIEAKFWAGLTDSQPVAYIDRLLRDQPSALLFVAPEARRESLWGELRARVVDADGLEWRPDPAAPGRRAAGVGGGRRLLLTSWTVLLDRMASRAIEAREAAAELDIRQLRGLADRMDERAFLPLRSEELGPEFPRRILGLQALMRAARTRAVADGIADTNGLTISASAAGYGGYLRLADAGAWLGVRYGPWARSWDTPCWLSFYEWSGVLSLGEVRRRLAPLEHAAPPGLMEESDGRPAVAIPLPTGVARDAIIDAVVARLAEIAALLVDDD